MMILWALLESSFPFHHGIRASDKQKETEEEEEEQQENIHLNIQKKHQKPRRISFFCSLFLKYWALSVTIRISPCSSPIIRCSSPFVMFKERMVCEIAGIPPGKRTWESSFPSILRTSCKPSTMDLQMSARKTSRFQKTVSLTDNGASKTKLLTSNPGAEGFLKKSSTIALSFRGIAMICHKIVFNRNRLSEIHIVSIITSQHFCQS